MGLTTAMFTGLSGLNTNQFRIDTVGDNIANVNTTAFKGNRAMFENQFSIMLSAGTGPSGTSGGTNPSQIGQGSALGSVQRNFQAGSIETTGVPTDLAIEGDGFFVLRTPESDQAFTRDGTFALSSRNMLVSADGFYVQGYGVDNDFNIVTSRLTDLEIPVGALTTARATSEAVLDGNLNASGLLATQGTILHSQALEQGPGAPATASTLLTELYDPATPAAPLFAEDDVITLSDVRVGGRQVPQQTFTVTATSTLGDFLTFLQNAAGINTDPDLGGAPGITVSDTDPPGVGVIVIEGNPGQDNALDIVMASIRSSNPNFSTPFMFTQVQEANGDSVYTSFIAYDSLGTPVHVNLTMTLVEKTNGGVTWRFQAVSYDDTDTSPVLGETGTVTFDNDGRMLSVEGNNLTIDRANTGAVTPMSFELDFSRVTGLTTQRSTLVMTTQNGFATGTLTNFSVGTNGVITGAFSNGLTRSLGQVALAKFTNPEGLVGGVNNLFFVGANSGQPLITTPETLGVGRVRGGALELSNVDLTREFIGLITASTGFSASGRVISTSNELLNELLLIAR